MVFRGIYVLAVFVVGLSACSTNKENNWSMDGEAVTISILNAMPHCGGAPPMQEDIYPIMEANIACTLSVHQAKPDGSRGKKMGEIITDQTGKAKVALKKGKYQLWKMSKLESFGDFRTKESPELDKNYSYGDETCFRKWYDEPDFEFEVTMAEDFSFAYQHRCFTGAHPCLEYSGPFPP